MPHYMTPIADLFQLYTSQELFILEIMAYIMILSSFVVLPFAWGVLPAPYGRYSSTKFGFEIKSNYAWFMQELPAFIIPLVILFLERDVGFNPATFCVGLLVVHYFQRTFIYSPLIRGGKPTPFFVFLMAFFFCTYNGILQGSYLIRYAALKDEVFMTPRLMIGTVLFLAGLGINIHSDHVMRTLRGPGETGYKIPQRGFFKLVSCANFLGEIIEWWGFALATWSLSGLAFAVFTTGNLVPRAVRHHRWYKEKFEDYPPHRKMLIPFVF